MHFIVRLILVGILMALVSGSPVPPKTTEKGPLPPTPTAAEGDLDTANTFFYGGGLYAPYAYGGLYGGGLYGGLGYGLYNRWGGYGGYGYGGYYPRYW